AGPRTGARALAIEALAAPERELAQADEARLGAVVRGVLEARFEQRLGGRVARVGDVHHRRRDADDALRSGRAHRLARQRMHLVRQPPALRRRRQLDVKATVTNLDAMAGDAVVLVAGLAGAARAVEAPVVPRADDVLALERALAERPADVVTDAGDGAEAAVAIRQREAQPADVHFAQRSIDEVGDGAEIGPAGRFFHDVPPGDLRPILTYGARPRSGLASSLARRSNPKERPHARREAASDLRQPRAFRAALPLRRLRSADL